MRIFMDGVPFWKGNTHCHTTDSDGALTPDEVIRYYESRGYDFLAITDHRLLSKGTRGEKGMLVLPGMEWDFNLPGQVLHLVGIGLGEEVLKHDLSKSPQSCVNQFRRSGGRVILAHPAWSLNTPETLCSLQGITAVEIYNSVSTWPYNAERADSSVLIDEAGAMGRYFNVVAADDAHHYSDRDAGRSFIRVQAPVCDWEHLRDALDQGLYYASQGPEIHQIEYEDGIIRVECSPVEHVIFNSNAVWLPKRCVNGHGMTQAMYDTAKVPPSQYFRIELIDQEGRRAWSCPVLLNQ